MRPLQCNRCWESFQSEKELKVHLRLEEICNLEPEMIADGIDKHTEEQLKSKRRVPGVITEVDKWKQVWRILFPEDPEDKIPDPCMLSYSSELCQYNTNIRVQSIRFPQSKE